MPTKNTTISPGVRVERFAHLTTTRVTPRITARHRTGPFTLTAALGRYARDLDSAEGIPRDLRPERATHGTLGGELVVAEGVTASLAGFYTHRRDLVVEDFANTDPETLPFRSGGTGRSVGFETLVRATRARCSRGSRTRSRAARGATAPTRQPDRSPMTRPTS